MAEHRQSKRELIKQLGKAVFSHDTEPSETGFTSDKMMRIGKVILQSYNTNTGTKGGLTEQILSAVEMLFAAPSNGSQSEVVSTATKLVKGLLSQTAATNTTSEGSYGFSRKFRKISEGILAKKVLDDLLSGYTQQPGLKKDYAEKAKALIIGVLTKRVAKGESSTEHLQHSGLRGLLEKGKLLAGGLTAEKSAQGLASHDYLEPQGFIEKARIMAESFLASESVQGVLSDPVLAAQAKEIFTSFDMHRAKKLAQDVTGKLLDKSNTAHSFENANYY